MNLHHRSLFGYCSFCMMFMLMTPSVNLFGKAVREGKLYLNPEFRTSKPLKGLDLVQEYLKSSYRMLGIKANLSDLMLKRKTESLLGTHYVFQQIENKIAVSDSSITVSVLKKTSRIYRVYNNLKVVNSFSKGKKIISQEQAYDLCWEEIGGRGDLLHDPRATLEYRVVNGTARLTFRTEIPLTKPYGYWVCEIDAVNSEILSTYDHRINLGGHHSSSERPRFSGASHDRALAFKRYRKRKKKTFSRSRKKSLRSQDGSALVFDPDPRTSLMKTDLNDSSPADLFEPAYFKKVLKDISFDGKIYHLSGPFVVIEDFDPPSDVPSVTTDGDWKSKRGENAFNDAMTYYHLDKSQRYIQSLGFVGDRAIQNKPIRVDTDGANGADNSYFQPSTNTLSFGHGCVDDNEDADVILHEYGHAIHHSINHQWGGGDSGAIGEGFGDYWAGSYSVVTEHGLDYFPSQVFSWDGHGEGRCWAGRVMDAFELIYDHSRKYGAHERLPGGHQTDELWSTPLFQSLVALMAKGISREEVDRIILESHFGLGSGVKMRELALSTIQVAELLYPKGPHSQVFLEKFSHHRIIELPKVEIAPRLQILSAGDNNIADPLEKVRLNVVLTNNGELTASKISGFLMGSESISVLKGSGSWPDIMGSQSARSKNEFEIEVGDIECGSVGSFTLNLEYNNGESVVLPLSLPTGVADKVHSINDTEMSIPDDDPQGVSSMLSVSAPNALVSERLKIRVHIQHTYIGDLKVELVSPSGTHIKLHHQTGGGTDDIIGVYGIDLQSEDPLGNLVGEPLRGSWRLIVTDASELDTGKIISWSLEDIVGYSCNGIGSKY